MKPFISLTQSRFCPLSLSIKWIFHHVRMEIVVCYLIHFLFDYSISSKVDWGFYFGCGLSCGVGKCPFSLCWVESIFLFFLSWRFHNSHRFWSYFPSTFSFSYPILVKHFPIDFLLLALLFTYLLFSSLRLVKIRLSSVFKLIISNTFQKWVRRFISLKRIIF